MKKPLALTGIVFAAFLLQSCSAIGSFFGAVLGIFWWVVLVAAVIVYIAALVIGYGLSHKERDTREICTMGACSSGPLIGAILGGKLIGGFLPVLAGFIIGSAVFMPIAFAVIGREARKIAEAKRLEKQEKLRQEEAERKRLEEIEKKLPIEERLARLKGEAQKAHKENSAELKKANQEFSQISHEMGSSPEKLYKKYNNVEGGDTVFDPRFTDAFTSSGVEAAKERYKGLADIAKYFAIQYNVSACSAKLENDRYSINRKRAVLFAGRLKEIYSKLAKKQKERKIQDIGEKLNIGGVSIDIPDTLRNVEKLSIQLHEDRKENIGSYLKSYNDFKREVNLPSDGATATVFLATMVIGGLLSKYSDNKQLKEELSKDQNRLHKEIENLQEGRTKAEAFIVRAKEINMALEKTMEAYEKMFMEVYTLLYPVGDVSKLQEIRDKNEKEGKTYFSDEEAEAVLQLRATGQFLLNIVDTDFEGEKDE
jgi:hypothetical protein